MTMSGPATSLRGLRDRPFELLKELEKRSRAVTTGAVAEASVGLEWVGVAFRMGGETFLVAREETREVLGYPAVVTRIPGAKSWVKGLANIRGQFWVAARPLPAETPGLSWSITGTYRRG